MSKCLFSEFQYPYINNSGPGIGIAKVPTAGRNFEYLCGEDPYLGAILVQPMVRGMQENGVIATAKHFVNNKIENERSFVSANVNERVRFEIYYPPCERSCDPSRSSCGHVFLQSRERCVRV